MKKSFEKYRTKLKELYINKKKSIPEISEKLGMSQSKVRRWLIKNNIKLRTPVEGLRNCKNLGKHLIGRKNPHREESKNKIRKAAIERGKLYAKGYTLKRNGYIRITRGPHKGRGQHCVITEKHLGRKLLKKEHVHHINGIRSDNRIKNLEVLTKSEHSRLHAKEKLANGVLIRTKKGTFKGNKK
jgi:DNA-binding MarR family transcriptional regulator